MMADAEIWPVADMDAEAAETGEWSTMTPYDEAALAATAARGVPITERLAGLVQDGENVVDGRTGEIVQVDDPAVATALFGETLATYARAKVEAQALSMRLADMETDAIAELSDKPDYVAAKEQRDRARQVMAEVEAVLSGLFGDRDTKVSIDTTGVLVTWPKPREAWSLAKPASWYATAEARASVVALVARLTGSDDYDQNAYMANAIITWLAPTAKVSEPGAPSITVRDGK